MNRQLAAILFTDIEGYSAQMQKDEQVAIAMKNRHREIIQQDHKAFNGRIVQYFGDGTLSIFQSAVDAVKCAVSMQQAFCQWPKVPVRMGLHLGDIIVNEENIFGDGVNLASRIESLAVPGSVLISDKMNKEMQNHPEVKTISIGSYYLKNIQQEVEVFALRHEGLVVPDHISGSGKIDEKKSMVSQRPKKLRLNHKTIAVLPFRNITNDESIEWLSNGFTEELTSAIAGISDLKVKSSTAMMQYKSSSKNFEQIAEELHVSNFIEGSVQKIGGEILINAHLIDPKSGEIRKPFRFKMDFSEINFIYSQIAEEVAENLNAILNNSEKQRLKRIENVNSEVYQLFLQGKYEAQKLDYQQIPEAIRMFEKCLQIEHRFAPAMAGIANCYITLGYLNVIAPAEAIQKTMPLLVKALKIDPNLAFAHTNLGWATMWFKYDLNNADKEFIKGNELDPSDAICIQGAFFLNLYSGNIHKAEWWCAKGKAVAPEDMWLNHFYGLLLFYKSQISESISLFTEFTIRYAHILNYGRLGWMYILTGNYKAAVDNLEIALNKFNVRRPSILAWLATAYFKNGNIEQANKLFSELENNIALSKPNQAFYTAAAYAFINNKDKAFELLEKSYELHDIDLLWLKMEPMLASLKDDERYFSLYKKIGYE